VSLNIYLYTILYFSLACKCWTFKEEKKSLRQGQIYFYPAKSQRSKTLCCTNFMRHWKVVRAQQLRHKTALKFDLFCANSALLDTHAPLTHALSNPWDEFRKQLSFFAARTHRATATVLLFIAGHV
jgi:hypothetical protein